MSHRASVLGRGYEDAHLDSPRLKFRRVLLFSLMTLVLPGSAQLAAGRRWVGGLALLGWLGLVGSLGTLVWRAREDRAGVITLLTNPDTLLYVRLGMITVAVLWLALFVDAWRLASPRGLTWPRRIVVAGVNLAIVVGIAGSTAYASQVLSVSREVVQQVFTATATSAPLQGRYNILLLGSDSGPNRTGIRTDSLTVASIDASTGRTVLVSLPRNLQNVPFPDDSPMKTVYPNGYNCGDTCLINAVHTAAANRTDLYPDSEDPGLDATIDAVEGATGLKINYYLTVNLKGFRSVIDAVGGVEVDVKTRLAMFGHDDAWRNQYIEPGYQRLNGKEALWYARSRVQSDDYTRMGRQKCLLSAMLKQLNPQTVVLNAVDIAKSGGELIGTSMPSKELGQFADLALKSRNEKIISVSLVPPVVSVTNPDYDAVHQMIQDAITESENQVDEPTDSPTTSEPSTSEPTPTNGAEVNPYNLPQEERDKLLQRTANNSKDLASSC